MDGRRIGGEFGWEAAAVKQLLPECVMSFAYWNPKFLEQDRY